MTRALTAVDWFLGSVYQTKTRVSLISDLVRPIRPHLDRKPYSAEAVADGIDTYLGSRPSVSLIGDQEAAYEFLIVEELRRVRETCSSDSTTAVLQERSDLRSTLRSTLLSSLEVARSIGLPIESEPELFFVTEHPVPYSNSPASILAIDAGDQKAFGIRPGLYILDTYRPLYTEYLLCHELIHVYLGEASPDIFCSRLEEGIAEVLGAGEIARIVMGEKLVEELFIVNRLSRIYESSWERYLDATRTAWSFVMREGLGALVSVVREGRGAVEAMEQAGLVGFGPPATREASRGEVPPGLYALMDRVCNTYPRGLVLSPGATLLAQFARQGATTHEAAAEANMSATFGTQCLDELQDEAGLLAMRQDGVVITFSSADRVAASGMIRFSTPER